jgi:hypothetical protein
MPKIGVYSRTEFVLGTARMVEDSENFTITAAGRKGEAIVLEIYHRHESPVLDARRKAKAEAQLALFNLPAAA